MINETTTTIEDGKQPRIPMDKWGEHHWFVLFLIEDVCVWTNGEILKLNLMRTNPKTHYELLDAASKFLADMDTTAGKEPFFAEKDQTVLVDGSVVPGHDSWDCVDDLTACNLITAELVDGKLKFEMQRDGWAHVSGIRKVMTEGKPISAYQPMKPLAQEAGADGDGWWIVSSGETSRVSTAYSKKNLRLEITEMDGHQSVRFGENTCEFYEDAKIIPMSVLVELLSFTEFSPLHFAKAALQHAKQICEERKKMHLALCNNDSDEASAAQAASECVEDIEASIAAMPSAIKLPVLPNDPCCDGCRHQSGSLFAPCRTCKRTNDGRTDWSPER